MSSEQPTDQVVEALELASEDQLIGELKRRNEGLLVVATRDARERGMEEFGVWWKGSTTLAMGLVARAWTRLQNQANTGSRVNEQRSDDEI